MIDTSNPTQAARDASRAARLFAMIVPLLLLHVSAARAEDTVVVPPIEVHDIEAKALDQTFRIQVALPIMRKGSQERFPVVYVTDVNGPFEFPEFARGLYLAGEMPAVIVVGIGYPTHTFFTTMTARAVHMKPKELKAAGGGLPIEGAIIPADLTGSAEGFLEFIRNELVPFIDSRYPTKRGDRAYVGDSLGGFFGLYVLFEKPDTFQRYVIGSPVISLGNEWLLDRAKRYTEQHADLNARVYMTVGGLEEVGAEAAPGRMVTNMYRLQALLEARKYPGLRLTTYLFPDETHSSVVYMNMQRGISKVFDPPGVSPF